MKKANTIIVTELSEGAPTSFRAFVFDNDNSTAKSAAVEQAEALFSKLIKENGGDDEDVEVAIDDGIFEKGTYSVALMWSEETTLVE